MLIIGQDAIKTWYTCREQGAPAHAPMQVQHVPHSTHISFQQDMLIEQGINADIHTPAARPQK